MNSLDESFRPSCAVSKKPKYSRFTQQDLPACKPILTPGTVIAILLCIAVVFIPVGLSSLSASKNVVEIVHRYDDACLPGELSDDERVEFIQDAKTNKTCTRTFTVPKEMKQPIFVYYHLDNFYQNHRRYVKSRNDHQLSSPKNEFRTKSCEPEALDDNNKPIVPCGLIAWSLFNDTFNFVRSSSPLPVNKKDISWRSDRKNKFGSDVYPKNFQKSGFIGGAKLNDTMPLSEQEDLIIWMRTAALPSFRKLYGKIEADLQADEKITVVIQNNYNTYSFNGKKKLVISTVTWIGGKNDFLGKTYLSVGGTSLFVAVSFGVLYLIRPRPLGDSAYLSWNRYPNLDSFD
ncbi:hypothetical protein M569_03657 [Genlisea aurea]|uniref:ALA-interacting subunit n=1 Tax=Genlisea aurea TaxID=192259 RepID=S8EEW5_9LAMI|nr:hypothetical protein M569_03657 [Genlisea aurea]